MKIIGWELKKILSDRALWVLLAVCVTIQACLLCGNLDQRGTLRWWNDLIGRTGATVTAESLEELRAYSNTEQECIKAGRTPQWAPHSYQAADQLDSLDSLIEEASGKLQSSQDFLSESLLPANGEDTALECRRNGDIRMRAAQANLSGEAHYFSAGEFFPGRAAFFPTLILFFYLEMLLISAYITSRSASLEFADGTQQLVYTCRRGRRLQCDKLAACLIAITFLYLIGAILLLGGYLLLYPQWNFLSVPYSADPFASGLSRFPVSFLGYILLHLGLGFLIVLVTAVLMFGLTAWGRSPMLGIAGFLAAGVAMMMTGGITHPTLALIAVNPISLLIAVNPITREVSLNVANWFCYTGRALDLPHVEWITALLWGIAVALLCAVMIRGFRKREVV